MTTWKPIGEAPRDGTPLLLYCPKGVYFPGSDEPPELARVITIGWWGGASHHFGGPDKWICTSVEEEWRHGSEWTGSWAEYEWSRVEPTHFMLLPKPPPQEPPA